MVFYCYFPQCETKVSDMTNAHVTPGSVPNFELRHRIQRAREFADMNQRDLAAAIGVSRATLANVEQGTRKARRGELIAIAFATGVDFEWIETGKAPTQDGPGGGVLWANRDSNPEPADLWRGRLLPVA